mmetsp:Transcript_28630/g.54790  ORF Transcript_28630/g.54790 Transcript_28630/m.54790 type:complete len:110 (+) Transcript_28630:46-375(+)
MNVVHVFIENYARTPSRLKVLDAFVVFQVTTSAIQFAYWALCRTTPVKGFLGGFICSLASAVLTAGLRTQLNPLNKKLHQVKDVKPERCWADFLVSNLILHCLVITFIG